MDFIERSLEKQLVTDLDKKMVILSGPRQCGKTALAKHLPLSNKVYLNYDVTSHRRDIISETWDRSCELLILDEIHKMRKWKSFLKGVYDGKEDHLKILVTGSARLDLLKRGGDSLAGRYFQLRLHPFTYKEISTLPMLKEEDLVQRLLERGGFPEPFLASSQSMAKRWRNTHLDRILRDDVDSIAKVSDIRLLEVLVLLLSERVGSTISYQNLASDLKISAPTVKRWIELLESLFIVFILRPHGSLSSRSLQKEPKIYFYDTGIVPEHLISARMENLVATHLMKYIHFYQDTLGEKKQLAFLRDKEKREVDFVIVNEKREIELLLEVKKSDEKFDSNLHYYTQKSRIKGQQIVFEGDRIKDKELMTLYPAKIWLEKSEFSI